MSTIVIANLCIAGLEMFSENESYLDSLVNEELNIVGGIMTTTAPEGMSCGPIPTHIGPDLTLLYQQC
jgi:hypothetical protein